MNKPFTELPLPKRTHRLSIVAEWNPIHPPQMKCESAGCKQSDVEEITECPCCGRWMCMAHWGGIAGMLFMEHCLDCKKLTYDERQAVMELRAKLEAGGVR